MSESRPNQSEATRKAMPEPAAMKPTWRFVEPISRAYRARKTFELSTAQLESRLIEARHSGKETRDGREKRRIFSRPLSSALKEADDFIIACKAGYFHQRLYRPRLDKPGCREYKWC